MLRSRTLLPTAVLAVFVTGCEVAHPADPLGAPAPVPLDFLAPLIAAGDVRAEERVVHDADDREGPARADISDAEYRPLQEIFSPDTRLDFREGYALSMGIHHYIGNMGSVETWAEVQYEGQGVGQQSSIRQDYTPYFFDFGRVKGIWTQAKVFSDQECGLSVQGKSVHKAWWQWFQGVAVPLWGMAIRTTQKGWLRQPDCPSQTWQGSGAVNEGGGLTCYYLITYDLETGEILHAELLYCTQSGGEQF